jgi:hypothetical protein
MIATRVAIIRILERAVYFRLEYREATHYCDGEGVAGCTSDRVRQST